MRWRDDQPTEGTNPPSAGFARSRPAGADNATDASAETAGLAHIVQASKDSPCHVPAYNVADARAHLVDPRELIGAQQVCDICGWKTRKSIGDHGKHGFPPAVASVSGTRLWTRTQVTQWHATHTTPKPESSQPST